MQRGCVQQPLLAALAQVVGKLVQLLLLRLPRLQCSQQRSHALGARTVAAVHLRGPGGGAWRWCQQRAQAQREAASEGCSSSAYSLINRSVPGVWSIAAQAQLANLHSFNLALGRRRLRWHCSCGILAAGAAAGASASDHASNHRPGCH